MPNAYVANILCSSEMFVYVFIISTLFCIMYVYVFCYALPFRRGMTYNEVKFQPSAFSLLSLSFFLSHSPAMLVCMYKSECTDIQTLPSTILFKGADVK